LRFECTLYRYGAVADVNPDEVRGAASAEAGEGGGEGGEGGGAAHEVGRLYTLHSVQTHSLCPCVPACVPACVRVRACVRACVRA
jgi:hypothetical protein